MKATSDDEAGNQFAGYRLVSEYVLLLKKLLGLSLPFLLGHPLYCDSKKATMSLIKAIDSVLLPALARSEGAW